jgi:hypothetical protein
MYFSRSALMVVEDVLFLKNDFFEERLFACCFWCWDHVLKAIGCFWER